MGSTDDATTNLVLQGQAEIWKLMFSFVDSMALKCAVELRIPDILHSHSRPLSLSEIATNITNSSCPNIHYLSRIMRLLVHKKIFTYTTPPNVARDSTDPSTGLYGLTPTSRWLVRDTNDFTLASMVLLQADPWKLDPWHQLSACVREGGIAFQKAHGLTLFEALSKNPEFNKVYNDGMGCNGKIAMHAILSALNKDTWDGVESLVDVGGGTGKTIAEIVKAYPHIKGINFDLPHVVATAPKHDGVSHVSGDMFDAIPSAQAVFSKWVMHDWGDEDCVKILKNFRKAIPEKTGKIFIVDVVLKPDGNGLFDSIGMIIDLTLYDGSQLWRHGED